MIVWRIAVNGTYNPADLTGAGAMKSGGRWNHKGHPVVYCAINASLCCLENLVHMETSDITPRHLVEIRIPDSVWNARIEMTAAVLPSGWDSKLIGSPSRTFGTQWLQDRLSAVMVLPSVPSPFDLAVLINPLHPDARKIKATDKGRWDFDPRLFQARK